LGTTEAKAATPVAQPLVDNDSSTLNEYPVVANPGLLFAPAVNVAFPPKATVLDYWDWEIYPTKVALASFSPADPFTHCQDVLGFRLFASSG